jgi:hypothetical protein
LLAGNAFEKFDALPTVQAFPEEISVAEFLAKALKTRNTQHIEPVAMSYRSKFLENHLESRQNIAKFADCLIIMTVYRSFPETITRSDSHVHTCF